MRQPWQLKGRPLEVVLDWSRGLLLPLRTECEELVAEHERIMAEHKRLADLHGQVAARMEELRRQVDDGYVQLNQEVSTMLGEEVHLDLRYVDIGYVFATPGPAPRDKTVH